MRYPTKVVAHQLLDQAVLNNPGPWYQHSKVAAHCAEAIAERVAHLDGDKAYVLGLLHDIGRHAGVYHFKHIWDGYQYMQSQGYHDVARICLSHSFNTGELEDYVGKVDVDADTYQRVNQLVTTMTYDDYDRLIQLCDALADATGPVTIKQRLDDVARRYGDYPKEKRQRAYQLKDYFDQLAGCDIYQLL